jgi:hypothetical protein
VCLLLYRQPGEADRCGEVGRRGRIMASRLLQVLQALWGECVG